MGLERKQVFGRHSTTDTEEMKMKKVVTWLIINSGMVYVLYLTLLENSEKAGNLLKFALIVMFALSLIVLLAKGARERASERGAVSSLLGKLDLWTVLCWGACLSRVVFFTPQWISLLRYARWVFSIKIKRPNKVLTDTEEVV